MKLHSIIIGKHLKGAIIKLFSIITLQILNGLSNCVLTKVWNVVNKE